MDKLLNNITKHILIYALLFIGIFLFLNFFLYIANIKLRLIPFIIIIILLSIGFIGGLYQLFLKFSKKVKIYIVLSILLVILVFLNLPITINIPSFKPISEQTIKIEDKMYVAVIKKSQYTDISYYDYFGPFLMGTKEKIHGYFEGCEENPYKADKFPTVVVYSYYNNNGEKIKVRTVHHKADGKEVYSEEERIKQEETKIEKEPTNEKETIIEEEKKVLAEYEFENTIFHFVNLGYILGQNQIIAVEKSTDKGQSFHTITKEPIQVSNEARFTFLNENLAFVISTGRYNLKNGTGLYVTQDGGKTFDSATIQYKSKAGIDTFIIEKYPYYEKGKLKLDCLIYDIFTSKNQYEELTKIFISTDNGLTWSIEK